MHSETRSTPKRLFSVFNRQVVAAVAAARLVMGLSKHCTLLQKDFFFLKGDGGEWEAGLRLYISET